MNCHQRPTHVHRCVIGKWKETGEREENPHGDEENLLKHDFFSFFFILFFSYNTDPVGSLKYSCFQTVNA